MSWVMALFAQASSTSSASGSSDPFGPIVTYILSFGTLGAVVVGSMFGYIDLRPSVARQDKEDLKKLNADLTTTLNDEVAPALEAAVTALQGTTAEIANLRQQIVDLRLDMARAPKGNT